MDHVGSTPAGGAKFFLTNKIKKERIEMRSLVGASPTGFLARKGQAMEVL